jgi:hypothetical protein
MKPKLSLHLAGLFCATILQTGCRNSDLNSTFKNHQFDKQVIERLPVYDSLANTILANYPSAQFNHRTNSYRYIPNLDGNDLYKVFSKEAGDKVKQLLTQLGPNLGYGFECYKDSTMKFLIRDTYIGKNHLSIRERLSYYPPGKNIRHREFPIKDTILTNHWQYWISFEEEFFGAD